MKTDIMQRLTIKGLLSGVVLTACIAATSAKAETAYIYFIGFISGQTCSLKTSDIIIRIGRVDKAEFKGVGSTSDWSQPVSLMSAGCNASLVSMTFSGLADGNDPGLFAVDGGAAGIGIQLSNGAQTAFAVPNDPNSPIRFSPAPDGQGYSFSARYVQTTPDITPGDANATITVLITYT
jgi:type 1 fimbria pilin